MFEISKSRLFLILFQVFFHLRPGRLEKGASCLEYMKRNKIVWKKMEAVDFELEKVLIIL